MKNRLNILREALVTNERQQSLVTNERQQLLLLLILPFLLIFKISNIFAQYETAGVIKADSIGFLQVTGYIEMNRKPLENARIIVYEGNKKVSDLRTPPDGKFNLKFEFNKYFKVEITKMGLVTKKFEFNTHLPDSVDNQQIYSFNFNIALFPKYEYIDMSILEKPLAIIKYQFRYNDFFYDYNYAKSINDKVIDLQNKVEELTREYSKSVDEGRKLYDFEKYKEALAKFQRAHDIFPDESYPIERIAAINKILNEEKAKKENYDKLITEAEKMVKEENYNKAIDLFGQAIQIFPAEKYPAQRIKDIKKLMQQLAIKEAKYKSSIEQADNSFSNKNYQGADTYYTEASNLFPNRKYPKYMLNEINKIKSELSKEALYNNTIKEADQLLSLSQYKDALTAYNKASAYKPNEQYPKEKIDFINKKMSELAYIQNAYNKTISEADSLLSEKDYENAKNDYIKASQLIPAEQYPKDKIDEIDKIFADIKANDKLYNETIAEADAQFDNMEYEKALELYNKALSYKPSEKYPYDQISRCNEIIAEKSKMEAQYNKIISLADKLLGKKEYSKAKATYEDALLIKPNEREPKEKINNIEKIVSKEENKLENYWKVIEKADESFDMMDYDKAKNLYSQALTIMPDEKYAKDKIVVSNNILEAKQSVKESYSRMIIDADLALSQKNYDKAKELYRKALEIKPNDNYADNKLKEIENTIKGFEANKQLYNSTILEADDLFNLRKYREARNKYKNALELDPRQKYPRERIREINDLLRKDEYAKAIDEINNELIEKNTEKKFSFNLKYGKQKTNYIIFDIKNLSQKSYKALVYYGKDEGLSGGFEIDIIKQEKAEKYQVSVGLQEKWLNTQNNWISIQPLGGDIIVNSIEIKEGN